MSDDYTPTTEEMCEWWLGDMRENSVERFERELEFDRFIAQVKAEALEEAASRIADQEDPERPSSTDVQRAIRWVLDDLRARAAEYRAKAH